MWPYHSRLIVGIAAVALGITAMGCATPGLETQLTIQPTGQRAGWDIGDLREVAYGLANRLVEKAIEPLTPMDTLIVASFVNIDDLEASSTFGRLIAEQIATRLAQHGLRVIEMKLRQQSVFIREGRGEFMLSRDLRQISEIHKASAIAVGTWADGGDRLYISARLVRPTDNIVLSAQDDVIRMDPRIHWVAGECFIRGLATDKCRALQAGHLKLRQEGLPGASVEVCSAEALAKGADPRVTPGAFRALQAECLTRSQ